MKLLVENKISCDVEERGTQKHALLAVGKSLTDKRMKECRDGCEPAVVSIDHSINVKGDLVIHSDYKQTQVNKVCPWTFLQVAWDKMNTATRNAMISQVKQMLSSDVKPDVSEIKEVTKLAVREVKGEVVQMSRGQVKFNGTIWVTGSEA